MKNSNLTNELEADYNKICDQIKQVEQEIARLNGSIAENEAEIVKNIAQQDFSQMDQAALYREKLKKIVYYSISTMRGIVEICFKNGMIRYVLIKKHRNGGMFLLPETFKGDMERKHIIVPIERVDSNNIYTLNPTLYNRYSFDEMFSAFHMDDFEIFMDH